MILRLASALLLISTFTIPAFADDAAPAAKPRVQRHVERHNRDRSQAVKTHGRVLEIDTVVVQGRPGRPQAAVETSIQSFKFPVGTARYSETDQRFIKNKSDSTW